MWVLVFTAGKEEPNRHWKWSHSLMAVVWLTCEPSCLKMSLLSSPRSCIFFNPQSDMIGTNVVWVAGKIWAGSFGPENVHLWGWVCAVVWPQTIATQAKFWTAVRGASANTAPQADRMVAIFTASLWEILQVSWSRHYEPHPQSTKQRAVFPLSLMNELIDASVQGCPRCGSGAVWGEVTHKVEEGVVLKERPILLGKGIVNLWW